MESVNAIESVVKTSIKLTIVDSVFDDSILWLVFIFSVQVKCFELFDRVVAFRYFQFKIGRQ